MTAQVRFRPAFLLLGLVPSAILLGYILATRGPLVASAVMAAPVVVYVLLRHRLNGLLCGIVLMAVIPYWYTFGVAQAASIRVAVILALATCVFAPRVRLTIVDVSVLLLALVAVLGWLLQDNQPGVGKIVLAELVPFGFFVAARTVSHDTIPRVMAVIFGAGALGALTVFYETYIGQAVFVDAASYSWNATDALTFRAGGIFGSPPGAATVLAMTALCGLPLLRTARGRRLVAARATFALTVIGCVLTSTRASIIGLTVGVVAYLWLARSPLLNPRRLVVGALLVATVVVFALPSIQSSSLYTRRFVRPGNLAIREAYWQLAVPIVSSSLQNAVFGIGTAATLAAREGARVPAELAATPVLIDHGTHNQYVLALLEEGLVGVAALAGWLATTLFFGMRGSRDGDGDPVTAALVACVIAFAIIMLANNALLHPPSAVFVALASGLLVARKRKSSELR